MKRKLQVALGLLVGVVLVVLLFRGTNWSEVWASILTANPWWLLLTQVPAWLSFFTRVLRWRYIVRSVKPVSFSTLYHATQIGFFANSVLPLRAGEVIRAFILARRAPLHFSKSVALVALDRVTDLFAAAAFMAVTLFLVDMSKPIVVPAGTLSNAEPIVVSSNALNAGATVVGLTLVVLVGLLAALYLNQRLLLKLVDGSLNRISKKLAAQAHHLLEQFAQGLQVFRSGGDMLRSLLWSLVTWICFALGAYCGLKAFHLDFPWYTPIVLQTLLAAMVSVPGAPGFIGQYHLGVVLCLIVMVPNMAQSEMRAVAIVLHLVTLLPVIIAGIVSLMMENAGLLELTRQSAKAEETFPSPPEPEQAK